MKAALALIDSRKDIINSVVPQTMRSQMTWESIRTSIGMAVAANSKLQEAEPQSVYSSCLYILRNGLEIGGYAQQAFLVPFYDKKKGKHLCTPMIGAQGKIEMAYRSGRIDAIRSAVVYENDHFVLDLATGELSHRPEIRGDRGRELCAWAGIWVKGMSDPLVELMSRQDFEKIKSDASRRTGGRLSPAYQNWPTEMWRRSVINRALKRAPKSRDLVEMLGSEVALDLGAVVSPDGTVPRPLDEFGEPLALPDHTEADAIEAETVDEREPVQVDAPIFDDDEDP